ncbi:MAG: hypothetical protein CL397_15475 [Acidiferrobacteraceae bacterium]|nr:hypothetical protein [Acidiferrobacteraceae bacterium]
MVPPDDGAALVKKLGAKDSIAFVRLDSMKPAMVTIYRCTADDTLYGPELPAQIVLTFPHFPDCRRMQLGSRYLCALRNVSTTLRQHHFVISVGTQFWRGPAPDPPGFFQA